VKRGKFYRFEEPCEKETRSNLCYCCLVIMKMEILLMQISVDWEEQRR
jgi:hypothetical protein